MNNFTTKLVKGYIVVFLLLFSFIYLGIIGLVNLSFSGTYEYVCK